MKLILITSEQEFDKELELIGELFKNGLKRLHIRKPDADQYRLKKYIESIPSSFHNKCVLHYDIELFQQFELGGFHMSEKQREIDLKVILNASQSLSTSVHHLNDDALNNNIFNYIFFSPVFKSISKEDHSPQYTLEQISDLAKEVDMPIYALGGISYTRISYLLNKGFDGIAVLGTIWNTPDPMTSFLELQKQIASL